MPSLSHVDTALYVDSVSWDLANRVRDRGTGADSVATTGSHWHLTISDGGAGGDTVRVVHSLTIVDHGQGASTPIPTRAATLLETGHGHDVATPKTVHVETVLDGGRGVDRALSLVPIATISETGHGSDSASGARVATVLDAGAGHDAASSIAKLGLTVLDGGFGHDLAFPYDARSSADQGTGSDTVIGLRRVTLIVTDGGTGGDHDASHAKVALSISDHGRGADAVSARANHALTVVDSAQGEDFVRMPASSIPGLWLNTTSAAASSWDGLPFNSMVEQDGTVYGAGALGIYRMNADDDAGRAIASEVLWDLDDFGSPQTKHVGNVYIAASGRGPYTVKIVNEQGTFRYPTTLPKSSKATNHRATTGRGLESRYYRIGVEGDFDGVNGVIAEYVDLSRRL